MRREVITWSAVLGVIVLGFSATVLVLNSTLYSASGFVRTYVDALQRHDFDGAIELAGTVATGSANRELLVREAMGELDDIRVVDDDVDATGIHHVVVEYSAGGVDGSTEFLVRRDGALFGLFNGWAFASSPLATVQLTVQHERVVDANGVQLIVEQDVATPYLVFTPSLIEFTHDTKFFHAEPVDVLVSEAGAAVSAAVDIQATDAFVANVQGQIDDYLDACASQAVLLPAGCPFGETIVNRVVTQPTWSMTQYPVVTLVPDGRVATWRVEDAAATAHLLVDVQSLFDGSISFFDEDVPFTVAYEVTILPDGDPLIVAIYD